MEVIVIPNGAIEENCYILFDPATKNALIIDPGDEPGMISGMVEALGLHVQAILLTHAHYDHIGAVDTLVNQFHTEVYLHENEIPQTAAGSKPDAFMPSVKLQSHITPVQEGEQKIGSFNVRAIFAPGHSAGSTMYLIGQNLFSGDVLFQGSIGRTDLPGGNPDQMVETLRMIRTLNPSYTVYPGHGPATTLADELTHNPYLAFFAS